jgi:RHS repeat-associated protein
MTRDENKKIVNISYNHLNLPTKIIFATNEKIHYLYNAVGQKVFKKIEYLNMAVNTEYVSGFDYQNGILQYFATAEGYVRVTDGKFNYVYNYTDHLGNVRLSYGLDTSNVLRILEENNYYPFGLKHKNYNMSQKLYYKTGAGNINLANIGTAYIGVANNSKRYNYKYQGQERQDELGLNWDSFKWRNYDYAIGRFFGIDKLSEKYYHNSPYAFSENRVVDGRELEGLEVQLINPTKSASTEQQKVADQKIVNGAQNINSSSTLITVTGHGNPNFIMNDVRGGKITTGKQLDAVLSRNSDDWKNRDGNAGMTVVLYSCRTGANEKNKDGTTKDTSIAQQISGSKEFKDVEIIAPDQRMYFSNDGPVGTYEAKYAGTNDEYKADAKDHSRSETPGNWNVFKNGELIRSYQGDWKPTDKPSTWDNLTKKN